MLMSLIWKRIVEAEPSPICAFDHKFRLTAFNAAHSDQFFAIYGHRVQVGEVFPDLFLPEQGDIIRGFMARALSGEVFEVVEEFGNPDLSKPFWSISYAPLRDDAGSIIGAFHRALDISAQLRSAAELAAAKRALQGQAQALHDSQDFARLALTAVGGVGVWTYDVPLNRYFYDAAIATLYEIDPGQGENGLGPAEFLCNVHPADQASLNATMAGGLVSPGELELEYRLRHSDGSVHWVLSRGHTYFDESGRAIRRTGVGIDLTKQRLLEEQLRQSQKMEAVGQLTGGLAHDFNNLLTGITGGLEMLSIRVQQGRVGELARYVHAAQGAAKRAAALTHRLLAFSRRQTLDPKPTDVNRLVSGMTELLQRTIGPVVELEFVAAGGLWSTLVDRGQLESALLNLCINARDAMPDGGKITIETGNKWLDERAARQRELPPGQYITVCVSDTGTGMPPEVVARAFDPFFTTKPIGLGTGLGLSMVYGFARQSGGEVRIYSELDRGTMVCLYLPRHGGVTDTLDDDYTATVILSVDHSESVLVVDDEPTVRMLIVEVLQEMGCAALEADDGTSALRILRSDAKIDLLISDVGLPGGMNGRQLADAARATRPELKILFVTGYAENAVLSHGHLEFGMHVLTKPFSVDGLMRRVKDLMSH